MMNRRVYLLLGLSALAVVISHACSRGLNALIAWTHRYQSVIPLDYDPTKTFQFYFFVFIIQIFVFGIAAFFFVSGFFISYSIDKKSGTIKWSTIKNRVLVILIPYLIWTIFELISGVLIGETETLSVMIQRLVIGIPGFWFVPVLILFYLVSPWLIQLTKKGVTKFLIISGLLQLVFIILRYAWFGNIKISFFHNILYDHFDETLLAYIFYFPLGIIVATHLEQARLWLRKNIRIILVFTVTCFLVALLINEGVHTYEFLKDKWAQCLLFILTHCYDVGFILLFLAPENIKIPFTTQLFKLSSRTYGIYLVHIWLMMYFTKFIYHVFPILLSRQIIFTILNILAGLGGSLLLMEGVKKYLKSSYTYLFG